MKRPQERFKIQKNVPIPARRLRLTTSPYHILDEMRVGDSFLATGRTLGSVYGSCSRIIKKRNLKLEIIVRNTDEGVRVWRVK